MFFSFTTRGEIMKKLLCILAICLASLTCSAQEDSLYFFNAGLGVNFVEIEKVDGIDFAFDPGLVGTVCIGFHMNHWITAETEFAMRSNRFRKITADGVEFGVEGYLTKATFMQNFILNLTQRKYSPYFGFGVGLKKDSGNVKVVIVNGPHEIYEYSAKIDDAGTAFQLLGGIDIPMGEVSRLKLEYKFLQSEQEECNHSVILKAQKSF